MSDSGYYMVRLLGYVPPVGAVLMWDGTSLVPMQPIVLPKVTPIPETTSWPLPPVDAAEAVTRALHPDRIEFRKVISGSNAGTWTKMEIVGRTLADLRKHLIELYGRDPQLLISTWQCDVMSDFAGYQYRNIEDVP